MQGAIVTLQRQAHLHHLGPAGGPPRGRVAGGAVPSGRVRGEGRGGGADFMAWPLLLSCQVEHNHFTSGRTLGVMEQDLRRLVALLGK
jgi:hypothetical protein